MGLRRGSLQLSSFWKQPASLLRPPDMHNGRSSAVDRETGQCEVVQGSAGQAAWIWRPPRGAEIHPAQHRGGLRGPGGSPTPVTVIVSRGRGLAVSECLGAVRVIQPVPALPTPHSYARPPNANAVFILGLARFVQYQNAEDKIAQCKGTPELVSVTLEETSTKAKKTCTV
ncbi:hypothetical protein E2C01_000180 [Portunus trituberculatus]|uniref:Uncharacterized protein n=1 Tax=Portunus trituberculatus TaxID=210409 RepID=A0A5B7CGL9_PORTR|nr:hypothetical protein [Portunus trituberculatus]